MSDQPGVTDFLKKQHLFRGLKDDQLKSVAAELKDRSCEEGETVFLEGDAADALYIVFQGRVNVSRKGKTAEIKLATLGKGDYFGEQGLLKGRSRNATVRAEKGTILLALGREPFKRLLKKIPGMREMFDVVITSRQMASQLRFKWLGPDEVIYFLARKHYFLLFRALFLPVLVALVLTPLVPLAYIYNSATLGAVSAVFLALALAWSIWNYVDWGNDYYIVTNQRVIWLEKVIGLYDSRSEASMGTILSVSTETDQFSRWFDYGTVVVRTFTGQMRMQYVTHPKQAAAMIEDYWDRSKAVTRQADVDILKNAIRNKLGAPAPKPPAPPPPPAPAKPAKKESAFEIWRRDAFKMRTEASGVVTYRKHVYVLFRDTFWHNFGLLLLILAPWGWNLLFGSAPPVWFWSAQILIFLVVLGLWVYEYLDWSNDIYQVTADQIIDIYRKPLGTEDRKAAPLENILSTEYKRKGILGMVLNYGTVFIMVGGAQFNFEDVFDPPTVQQDIVRRQQARQVKKKESDGAAERNRMADWLDAYYRTVEEINKEKGQNQSKS